MSLQIFVAFIDIAGTPANMKDEDLDNNSFQLLPIVAKLSISDISWILAMPLLVLQSNTKKNGPSCSCKNLNEALRANG